MEKKTDILYRVAKRIPAPEPSVGFADRILTRIARDDARRARRESRRLLGAAIVGTLLLLGCGCYFLYSAGFRLLPNTTELLPNWEVFAAVERAQLPMYTSLALAFLGLCALDFYLHRRLASQRAPRTK